MDNSLSVFLFKVLVSRPKGLRVRLRVVRVSNHVETFDEDEHPTATLMPHGLFLAQPTPSSVKDPVLLGILNQKDLRDQEPNNEFGVFWSAQEIRLTNSEESRADFKDPLKPWLVRRHLSDDPESPGDIYLWSHQLSLTRHGIVKNIPHSLEFDILMATFFKSNNQSMYFKEFCAQKMSNLRIPPIMSDFPQCDKDTGEMYMAMDPYPFTPALIFIAFMRSMLQAHKDSLLKDETPLPQSSGEKAEHLNQHWNQPMVMIGKVLTSLYMTLIHLKRFLLPNDPVEMECYNKIVEDTQDELRDLAEVMMRVFFEPFCDTLTKLSVKGEVHFSKVVEADCGLMVATRTLMHELIRIGSTEFSSLKLCDLENLPIWDNISNYELLSCMAKFLHQPPFKKSFFPLLESNLEDFPLENYEHKGILQKVVQNMTSKYSYTKEPLHKLMSDIIVEDYVHLGPNFLNTIGVQQMCSIGTAKGKNFTQFGPKMNKEEDLSIMAVLNSGEITISILNQDLWILDPFEHPIKVESGEAEDRILRVQVFYQGVLTVTFPFGFNSRTELSSTTLKYFTGRYFLILNWSSLRDRSKLIVLDLKPCFQIPPGAPIRQIKQLAKLVTEEEQVICSYTFSDHFMSYLVANSDEEHPSRFVPSKPIRIKLIDYNTVDKSKDAQSIPCASAFEALATKLGSKQVYPDWDSRTRMLWSRDVKRLYYIHWRDKKKPLSKQALTIACFQVAQAQDLLSIIASSHFQLNHLLNPEVFQDTQRQFKILQTRGREYLVMDLIKDVSHPGETQILVEMLIAQAMFTIHRKQVHWVLLNGQHLYSLPQHIGIQTQYPGYDTSLPSLFHHRRVFSSNKVVSAVYQLDYRPL